MSSQLRFGAGDGVENDGADVDRLDRRRPRAGEAQDVFDLGVERVETRDHRFDDRLRDTSALQRDERARRQIEIDVVGADDGDDRRVAEAGFHHGLNFSVTGDGRLAERRGCRRRQRLELLRFGQLELWLGERLGPLRRT